MGRTLDTLKHGEHRAIPAPKAMSPAEDTAPEQCIVDWTLQDEVPFVEVGAPGKGIEMSPLLVKHPPQVKMQPPHAPAARNVAPPKTTPVVNLTDARPMTVAYESWPRPAAGGAIAAEIIAHHQPEHRITKEYTALADKMLPAIGGPRSRVLMLCSVYPHGGATTVLLNVAVVAAGQHRHVVVVDMNLAHPALAVRLGHGVAIGVPDVITGTRAIEQAVVPTTIGDLHLLAAGAPSKNNGTLTTEAMGWLAAWLRERYDVILIDGPCVENAADLAVLAPFADGIYLVLPQEKAGTLGRGIAPAIARHGGRLCGLIHTHFE
jgi:Mrp family chromosome partitioning ATPase